MKKNDNSQSGPVIVVYEAFYDDDVEICDKNAFEMIETQIDNSASYREFSCLILSATKVSAEEICNSFKRDLGFETEEPIYQHDMWTTRVKRQILISELKDSLKIVRDASANYSSKIFDWMIEIDKVQDREKPETVIIDTFEDTDIEVVDKKTFEEIEKHLVDLSKPREFDCLFKSETKTVAQELSEKVRNSLDYSTDEPYQDQDGWITHAVKLLIYSDLKDTLRVARETAAMHSSELFDWMVESDK